MTKRQLPKTVAIIIICVLLDIVLHSLTSAYSTMPGNPRPSQLAAWLGTEVTATLWALLAFSGVAGVFGRLQSSIPGVGLEKGLRYGTAISLLWLLAMLEGVPLFGHAIINEFVVGLSDAIPVLLLGILWNLFIAENGPNAESRRLTLKQKILVVCVFTGIFFIGRYIAYFTGVIQSGYQSSPLYTALWTLLMGGWIGVACILLENTGNGASLKSRAARFSMGLFGVNWATFLIFMPLMFSGYWADVLLRIVLDILLVGVAYYLTFGFKMKHIPLKP